MQVKKIVGRAGVVFIGYYLLTKPTGAANAVKHMLGLRKDAASSRAAFLNSL